MTMEKIKEKVNEVFKPKLIQFGPPRTGSTLLWNTLRVAYPQQKVSKTHRLSVFKKSIFCRSRIVASVRNPLDSIFSSIQRYEKTPTMDVIEQQLDEMERNGIWDLLEIKKNPRAMILKYEDFFNDWPYLFSQIESFLGCEISEAQKQQCVLDYSIDSVEKKSNALGGFSNYDKEDHIHGKHISKFRGQVGSGAEQLTEPMIEKIYSRFKVIFDEFGYEKPTQLTNKS